MELTSRVAAAPYSGKEDNAELENVSYEFYELISFFLKKLTRCYCCFVCPNLDGFID